MVFAEVNTYAIVVFADWCVVFGSFEIISIICINRLVILKVDIQEITLFRLFICKRFGQKQKKKRLYQIQGEFSTDTKWNLTCKIPLM